jgi:pimeloyl-ACP methyl ester carboxylesterase
MARTLIPRGIRPNSGQLDSQDRDLDLPTRSEGCATSFLPRDSLRTHPDRTPEASQAPGNQPKFDLTMSSATPPPKTRYAHSGDASIAYQIVGNGPRDLVFVPGFVSHLDLFWEVPASSRFFRRLASFARLILFDKRGTGLSDPVVGAPTLDERMDDVRAVMDAAGSEAASIFGVSEGGPLSLLFTATHPERVRHLIIFGSGPRFTPSADYPWSAPGLEHPLWGKSLEHWGEGRLVDIMAPSYADNARARELFARVERFGASPAMARDLLDLARQIDVRPILPSIQVPALILHRVRDGTLPVEGARYMAEHIPAARYIELPGDDHTPWLGDPDALLNEIEEFVTGSAADVDFDRVLATVLFTDIVDSTRLATEFGDRRWRDLLGQHDLIVRGQLDRFQGQERDKAGDGFLATFDRPTAAIHCASAISNAVQPLGVKIRAGLHTGECELVDDGVAGIAVHIGARVAAEAAADEILVSRTVKDLVAGSGVRFDDRGSHVLKGVEGEWQLFAVQPGRLDLSAPL